MNHDLGRWVCYRLWLTGILATVCYSSVYAQLDTTRIYELQQAEVSAGKRPVVVKAATPLQVVSGQDIVRLGYQNLADVVKRFNGVTVRDYGGIGGLKTVSVRSLGAHHTGVIYDGVAVSNCQAGQIDIGRFSLDNVARVSLAVGQEDGIFQPAKMFASAGVLSIQTERPVFVHNRKYSLQARVKGGSFGMVNPYLRYAAKVTDRTTLSVGGNFLRADGAYPFTLENGKLVTREKRYNSDILSWHTEANLYTLLRDSSQLTAKAYYFQSERGLPGGVIYYNPYNKERLWDQNFFAQAGYEKRFNRAWTLKAALKYNYSWNKYKDVNVKYENGEQIDRNRQHEYYGTVTALYQPRKNLSVSWATDLSVNKLWNNLPECPFPTRYTLLSALAVKYQYRFMSLTANLLNTYTIDDVKSGKRPKNREKLTPAVSLSLRPWERENLYFRFLYKSTFRVPTFNDLYYLRMGNTGLKPELAKEFNAGITWNGSLTEIVPYVSLTVDGYYNRVEDKIVARPTTYVWKMMNLGEVDITGVDVALAVTLAFREDIRLRISGGYTYQKAIDVTNPKDKNYKDQIPYTPKHSGNGALNLEMPWANVAYTVMGAGERYSLPQNIRANRIDGYAEHSASVSREFVLKSCRLRIQAELINFTDKQYDVIQFYPMPGRSYRLGMTWVF